MPLPKITTPTYELTLSSNNKKIKYRPYLVKEEKILLLALESEDSQQITNAIKDVLQNCVLTKDIEIDTLPIFDIEYLFLNIRSKSVGEEIDLEVTCPDDNETTVKVKIHIDSIKAPVKPKNYSNKLNVDDSITIEFKYPSLDQFIKNNFTISAENSYDQNLQMISACVDKIYTQEEVWQSEDLSKDELIEFLEDMNSAQFEKIKQFFESMPKLSHKFKVKNPKTKVENDITLEGLSSFFAS
ncbi:MAG: baseplate protein [Spirochaetia bacterium]|jgi:hypothetical protein|nr:baseplate protein [Spirochaetia bacterium]